METMVDASMHKRAGPTPARMVGVLFSMVLVAAFGFGPLVEIWYPLGHVGIAPDARLRIAAVFSGGAARSAGIRPGDQIDPQQFWPKRERYDPVVYFFPPPGVRLELPLIRGARHWTAAVKTREIALESPYRVQQVISTIFVLVALSIAAWLVVARPSVMTWSLFVALVGANFGGTFSEFLSPLGYWWVVGGEMLCATLQALWVFVLIFAIRIPNNRIEPWMRVAQRAAIAVFILLVAVSIYPIASWAFFGALAPNLAPVTFGLSILVYATTIAAVIHNYAIAGGKDRHRMAWVLFGAIVWASSAIVLWRLSLVSIYDVYVPIEVFFVVQSLAVVFIVYGIMRSRVVDVTFVLSRAVVVSLLTGGVILLFASLDWIFNKRLEATSLGAVTQFLAAIVLGIWLDHLHKRTDAFVDRLFFRTRYRAQRQLESAAHAILHADSVDVIREFLVDEPFSILDLGSAAVFQLNDRGDWERVRSRGWESESACSLSKHDPLIMHIEAEQSALRVSEIRWPVSNLPPGIAHPALAIPVLARRRVLAIALYGEHHNGADLDRDEIRGLESVANAAGAAFDHVEAEELRREIESLRRELGLRASSSTS